MVPPLIEMGDPSLLHIMILNKINVIFKFRGAAALLVGRRELGARAITHDVYSFLRRGKT